MKRKVLAGAIFVLVGVFFGVSYFGITTSGEDVFQGANTTPAVIEDAKAAFAHNARIPDMYAWAVINFFDYQYSFGVDTIFRLIDVLFGMGMLYLMTYVVLGRRLKLELKDAAIFALGFVMIFWSPHGRVLYSGFSAIHNYLLLAVVSLAFATPYLCNIGKAFDSSSGSALGRSDQVSMVRKNSKNPIGVSLKLIGMLVAGIIFGLSSNLTPVAFLMTVVTILVVEMVRERKAGKVLGRLRFWGVLGVVGVVIGMGIAYIGGPGVSGYIDSGYATEYDYLGFEELVQAPGVSAAKIVKHVVSNFGRAVGPAVISLVVIAGVRMIWKLAQRRKEKLVWWPEDTAVRKMVMVLGIFVVWHVLIATQLNAPLRILLPAYLATVMVVMILVWEWIKEWKAEVVGVGMLVLVLGVVGVRMVLTVEYHEKAGRVLEKIRESEAETVCLTREEVQSRTLPVVYLGQEDMVADWTLPVKIYDKEIVWCEEVR